jgi:hypothetical protein
VYASSSSALATGSALTFDGTQLVTTVSTNSALLIATTNANTGASADNQLIAGNGANNAIVSMKGTNFTTSGIFSANNAYFGGTGTSSTNLYSTNGNVNIYPAATLAATFTSTGLGIGTSSFATAAKLQVAGGRSYFGANDSLFSINVAYNNTRALVGQGYYIGGSDSTTPSLVFSNADGVAKATLDHSGNLGLGVTPSAWYTSTSTALQVRQASFYAVENSALEIGNNAFLTSGGSTWNYINTGFATRYNSSSGKHIWFNAPSGTAGNAISFTQAMTLDASGNLLVGTTTALARLTLSKSGGSAGSVNGQIAMTHDGASTGYYISTIRAAGSDEPAGIAFKENATERARINSDGDLLVGKTVTTFTTDGVWLQPAGTLWASRTSDYNLALNRNGTDGQTAAFYKAGTQVGNISVTGSATAYNTSSDYRLKNTITPMTGALAKVALLKPVTYKWNADGSDGEGFVAHELAEVCPYAVTGAKDAVDADGKPVHQGIDVSFLVATLTAAIQELKAEFDAYKASHP